MCRICLVLFLLVLACCAFDRGGIPPGPAAEGGVMSPSFPVGDGGQLIFPAQPPGLPAQPGLPVDGKVTLCHMVCSPPHTIQVDTPSMQAHLDHGDQLGPCP